MLSPEEILATQGAGLDRAVQDYGGGQAALAQTQFLNALKQQAEMEHVKAVGAVQQANEIALQTLRNKGQMDEVSRRAELELSNKKELLPIEHQNRIEEAKAAARAYLDRMDASEKAKLKSSYAAMGFRQDPKETDDAFMLRVNKAVADRANRIFTIVTDNENRANDLISKESQRLASTANDRATKEWATTLGSREKKLLAAPGATPDDVIRQTKDTAKKADLAASWSETLTRHQDNARKEIDPSVRVQLDAIKSANARWENTLGRVLDDKAFPGAVQFVNFDLPKTKKEKKSASMDDLFGNPTTSTGTGPVTPGALLTPQSVPVAPQPIFPNASGLGAVPGMIGRAGSAAMDAIGNLMFPRVSPPQAPPPSPAVNPLLSPNVDLSPMPPFAPPSPDLVLPRYDPQPYYQAR